MAKRQRKISVKEGGSSWRARVLSESVYLATSALVVCLFVGAGVADRYMKETGSPYFAAVVAAVLVDLANDDRAASNLNDLRINPKLVAAAQAKANDMAEKGYFAHQTPEGYDSWHWFEIVGYDYTHAGENLAVNFSESADVERAWMESPTHRRNILNENYTEIGIATAKGIYKGKEAVFAVQMFGRPSATEVARSVGAPPAAEAAVITPPLPKEAVLGETSVDTLPSDSKIEEPVGALAEEDGDAAVIMTPEQVPWWARIMVQPKESLRYAYYLIGLIIIAGLFLDMELELRWHHARHAMKAGSMLAVMSMLFIAADWFFFAEPILAAVGKFLQ